MITIITATYNRRDLLGRLFTSLQAQETTGIEWIIVDDGGSDATGEVVDKFRSQAGFAVRYTRKENGGKGSAINQGLEMATGDWVSVIDDDDYFLPGVFPTIERDLVQIADSPEIAGLSYLTVDPGGRIRGKKFPRDRMLSDHYACRINMSITGDKCEFTRAEALRQGNIRFDTNGRPGICGDTRFFLHIANQGRTLYVNTPILVKDFREDGITVNWRERCLINPDETAKYYAAHLDCRVKISVRARYMLAYIAMVLFGGLEVTKECLTPWSNRILYTLCYLPGLALAIKWESDRKKVHPTGTQRIAARGSD